MHMSCISMDSPNSLAKDAGCNASVTLTWTKCKSGPAPYSPLFPFPFPTLPSPRRQGAALISLAATADHYTTACTSENIHPFFLFFFLLPPSLTPYLPSYLSSQPIVFEKECLAVHCPGPTSTHILQKAIICYHPPPPRSVTRPRQTHGGRKGKETPDSRDQSNHGLTQVKRR